MAISAPNATSARAAASVSSGLLGAVEQPDPDAHPRRRRHGEGDRGRHEIAEPQAVDPVARSLTAVLAPDREGEGRAVPAGDDRGRTGRARSRPRRAARSSPASRTSGSQASQNASWRFVRASSSSSPPSADRKGPTWSGASSTSPAGHSPTASSIVTVTGPTGSTSWAQALGTEGDGLADRHGRRPPSASAAASTPPAT